MYCTYFTAVQITCPDLLRPESNCHINQHMVHLTTTCTVESKNFRLLSSKQTINHCFFKSVRGGRQFSEKRRVMSDLFIFVLDFTKWMIDGGIFAHKENAIRQQKLIKYYVSMKGKYFVWTPRNRKTVRTFNWPFWNISFFLYVKTCMESSVSIIWYPLTPSPLKTPEWGRGWGASCFADY